VCKGRKHTSSHHRFTGVSRPSLRNGFNGLLRALPGDRALLPPSSRGLPARDLTPASRRQDTTSPSALAPLVLRHDRVHRIPHPTSVTIAIRPLSRRDGGGYRSDLGQARTGIFLRKGLDTKRADLPDGQISGGEPAREIMSDVPHRHEWIIS